MIMIKRLPVTVFLIIESALYAWFMQRDLYSSGESAYIKFASVAVCLAFSAYLSAKGGDRIITAALGFTLAADVFLLIVDSYYEIGIALFCVAQLLYFVRIYRANGKRSAWLLRLLLINAALRGLALARYFTALTVLAAVYFTSLVCNAVQSVGIKNRRFTAGLLLLVCCDLCVGIHNAPELFSTSAQSLAAVGMWFFYLPSQVLITLSGRTKI